MTPRSDAPIADVVPLRSDVRGGPADEDVLAQPLGPGLLPSVRRDGSLQLGPDPAHGVVLTGLAEHETLAASRIISLLARASSPIPASTLARASGLTTGRVAQIARALQDSGLTHTDAPMLEQGDLSAWSLSRRRHGAEHALDGGRPSTLAIRRAGARVVIEAPGTLAFDVARLLRSAGVDQVRSGRYAGVGDDLTADGPDPTLIVTIGARLPRSRALDWHRRGITHLPVLARRASIDIGPVIVPGAGPCVRCIQLHDDGHLPHDLVLEEAPFETDSERLEPETSLAALAAGAIAMLALGVVDAYPPPIGVRWHTALPLPSLGASRWTIHDGCDVRGHRTEHVDSGAAQRTSAMTWSSARGETG